MRCPVCKHPSAVEEPICTRCGTSLGQSHAAGQAAPAAAPAPIGEGERRQLTVLFCDVVDSTGLAERLELEELRDLLDEYHVASARVVERYEGYVAEYLGDGMVIYFSYPQAHENDPERAARAGLEILAAVHGLATKLRVRVAIHTGEVLVEEPEPGRHLALGHPLNLTARLKDLAEPDMLVMSATTERLVRGLFETDDLGPQDLKGIAGQIGAYRVLRPRRARNRMDIASEAGLTPLTGRDADLVRLRERWQHARRGEGQVILVSGELGTGKSRLVRALRDDLAAEAPTWLECGGSPLHRDSAFQPLVELLRRHLPMDDGDTPQQRLAVLERAVAEAGLVPEAVVPSLAKLLSLPSEEDGVAAEPGPDILRRRTFEALTAWLVSLAKQGPMVLLVEDLHWADPSTLELLEVLIGALATAPVLLLATCRSIAAPAWEPSPQLTRHEVQPLSPEETATMVERVPGAAGLSEKMRDEVVRRTDGVPLFVEELTKSLLEAGDDEDVAIPATLRDSLMARLDRLGDDKKVAQLGAILGREFSLEEISAVSTWEESDLERGLTQLTAAELVYRSGAPGAVTYLFKHSLVREVAERSLLRKTRRDWNARVIQVFEECFPERAATEPERMARYCEAGTLTEEAVAYRQRAAGIASERFAPVEAIGHLTRAIELLSMLPESPPRGQQELELQVALGAAYCSTKGWGSCEAEQAFERARQLGEEIGETRQLFTVIRGLLTCYVSRVELDTAVELSARLLKLAEESGDPLRRMLAHHQAGLLQMFRGRQAESLRHMREALTYTGPGVDRDLATLYQSDPQVLARTWGAWPLWLGGMPDQALRRGQEAIEIAREGRHPHSLAHANASMAMIHLWRREPDAAAEAAEQALEICREHSFGTMTAGCTVTRSLSRIHPQASAASVEDALGDFGQAAGQLGELGGGCVRPLTLGLLAEALTSVGRAEEAREAVDGALVFSRTSGAQYWEAELHRVRAGLLAATGADAPEVNAALQRAVDVAREQGARMLELRAAVDLLRLTQSPEDRASLQGVYDTFDEGLELPDLAAARTLLHTTARA